MSALFTVILPVFLLIGAGYLAAWKGGFSASAVDGVMRYAQSYALPVLLFQAMARLDLQAVFAGWPMLVAFYAGAFASFVVGWGGARLAGREADHCVAIGFVCLFSNTLLLGVPITERAYGPEALAGNFAIVALHAPMLYTFGITVMEFTRARGSGHSPARVALRALAGVARTPLVIGIACGLAVNVAGVPIPEGVQGAVDMLARSALPAALFGLGGVLLRYRPEGEARLIALCCVATLGLHPAITWGLGTAFGLDVAAMRSSVITAAMPPGVNAYLFASMYGVAQRVAASSVLIATAVSLFTAWAWLSLLP